MRVSLAPWEQGDFLSAPGADPWPPDSTAVMGVGAWCACCAENRAAALGTCTGDPSVAAAV